MLSTESMKRQQMRSILDLDCEGAKAFFMTGVRYCTMRLPAPFSFDSILGFVQAEMGDKGYHEWKKGKYSDPSRCDCSSYQIQIAKNSPLAYRTISLVDPYLYYLLVRELTQEKNWKMIQKRMEELHVDWIERLAIPEESLQDDVCSTGEGEQISNWWDRFGQHSIELSLEYHYMLFADIADCYPSIYTHSIAWALHGRDVAKKSSQGRDKDEKAQTKLGDSIDKYIREMQGGETLGIPQGSEVFDFIAEIVLAYADKQLEQALEERGIKGIRVLRYRDDYRIFSDSLDDLKVVTIVLHQVLGGLHLNLNASKTYISEDPLRDSVKKDKLARIERGLEKRDYAHSSIQKQLLVIQGFSVEFPNSGSVSVLLFDALYRVRDEHTKKERFSRENLRVLIAITVDILMMNPRWCYILITMLSYFVDSLPNQEEKDKALVVVLKRLKQIPEGGHIEIWMAYLFLRQGKTLQGDYFSERLCFFLDDKEEKCQNPWDISWLKDEYAKDFPFRSICRNNWKPDVPSVIPIEEIELYRRKVHYEV